ncbi:hypothetical protein Gasu2_32630 [Galdieria sulphuraria]|nr:hypothetical protein Gasu2_32630 [Galdieria sulphuraria]
MSRSHPLGENNIQRIPASVINPRTGKPIRTDADTFRCLSEEQQMRAIEEEISNPRTTINPETNKAILLNGKTARELRAPGRLPRQTTPASVINPRTGKPIRTDADTFRCLSEEQQMRAIEEEISNPRTTINPKTNKAILLNGKTARELRAPGRLPGRDEIQMSPVSSQSVEPSQHSTSFSTDTSHRARRNSSPRQNGAMHRHRNHERHEESPASTERVDSETANRMSIDNSEDGHHIVIRKHVAVTSPVTPEENDRSPTVGTNETGSRRDTVNGHDGSVLRGPRRLEYDDSSQAQSTNLVPSSRRANTSSERVNCGCCSLM